MLLIIFTLQIMKIMLFVKLIQMVIYQLLQGKEKIVVIVAMVAKQQMLILILHLVSQSMPMETCILEITVIM